MLILYAHVCMYVNFSEECLEIFVALYTPKIVLAGEKHNFGKTRMFSVRIRQKQPCSLHVEDTS